MQITIKGELVDLNTYINAERSNKFMGAKIKKQTTETVAWEIKAQKISTIKGRNYYCFTWYCSNKRKDLDNISFSKKFIFDGLVLAGVLENDGWKQIAGFRDEFEVDKKNPRVVIDIFQAPA